MKDFFVKLFLLIHTLFIVFWWGLFFVPRHWWPGKIAFHFYLTIFVVMQQLVWGFVIMPWTKKYRMVCFLTTLTQILRGQNISDSDNYNHSFMRELFGRFGFNLPHRAAGIITFAILFVITLEYFLVH
jgi:hypothetical protein